MINNTSCLKLKLEDRSGFVSDEYQQKIQGNAPIPSNVNNNNNAISKNKYTTVTQISADHQQYKNSLPFYSKSDFENSRPTNECPSVITQSSSDDFVNNSGLKSSKCFDYDTCYYYNSTQENELTKKLSSTTRTESALNDISRIKGTDKPTSDTKSNFISGKKGNYNITYSKNIRMEIPLCRTMDQEYAFRQIEDVHNYSKLNRYGYCKNENNRFINTPTYSSNSSNQDEDDDEEDEEKDDEEFDIVHYEQLAETSNSNPTAFQSPNANKSVVPGIATRHQNRNQNGICPDVFNIEVEGNATPPDHHARRPMNAFLIFCKRHRGIVKDKYKSYENRSITKILGEWWASLDANDKKCYVNLAKQNKDAFFSANPNFKWYKLPAPSLRTLNTRPGNIERGENQYELNHLSTHNNLSKQIDSTCDKSGDVGSKKVSYFKLADEKQMGGLNNLMSPNKPPTSKNDALQRALSEATSFFNTSCNRKSNIDEEYFCTLKESSGQNFISSEDGFTQKQSVRSCKGKKYQELINSGQINAVSSKKIVSPKPSTNLSDSQYFVMHIDKYNKAKTLCKNKIFSPKIDAQSKTVNEQWVMTHYSDAYRFKKQQLGFVSFDLEDKIRRLPAQCLETYLQRKKNTKLKKKINSKKRSSPHQPKLQENFLGQTVQSSIQQSKAELEAKEQVIGSQKRKARKESITRRDITSIQSDVQLLFGSSHTTLPFVVGRRILTNQSIPAINQNASSDLLILAEVAANRTETAQ